MIADPRDRAAKLVYADWLLEAGDPHGAWIVLQLRGGEPGRRAALLEQMNQRLFGAPHPPGIQTAWREGFLSTLRIDAAAGAVAARLQAVLAERPARMLHTLAICCETSTAAALEALDLTGPHPTLRHLSLSLGQPERRQGWHVTLQEDAWPQLGALWRLGGAVPALRELELVAGHVEVAPLQLPGLQALTIRGALTPSLLALLQRLEAPRLKTLRIVQGEPQERDLLLPALLEAPALARLETLVLRSIPALHTILPGLLGAPLASGLRCLDLALCGLDPDAEVQLREALAAGGLPHLAWLAPWRECSASTWATLGALGVQRIVGWREDLRLQEIDGGAPPGG